LILLLGARAWAAFTPAEEVALAAGDVILHDMPPTTPGAIRVEGFVDIAASRDAVWAALLDFPARMDANKSLHSVETYRPATDTDRWIRWTAGSLGFSFTYFNHYRLTADRSVLTHELDPTQPNDLSASHGIYRLSPSTRGTLLDYDVESDFGISLPSSVKHWLTSSGLHDFLVDMAHRAEKQ
jgi:hypothetical protein